MGVTFREAIDNELITDYTLKLLPSTCKCGEQIEFNDSLRIIHCTGETCVYKILDRLINFCEYNNINISNEKLLNMINTLDIITPYQLIMLNEAYEHNLISDIDDIVDSINKIKSKDFYLYEIVSMCGIPNITKVAEQLFNGFNTIDDAFSEIEQGQLTFINERLGIKDIDNSVFSMDIYKELLQLKEELIFAETQFKIIRYSKVVKIAFCDNVLPFYNKRELIKYLDSTFGLKFNHIVCINDTVDILVRNFDISNNKVRIASVINDKYRAELLNTHKYEIYDLDKFNSNEIKPIGKKIYITSLEDLLKRLEVITHGEQNRQ